MGDAEMTLLRGVCADWEQGDCRCADRLAPDCEVAFARAFLDAWRIWDSRRPSLRPPWEL